MSHNPPTLGRSRVGDFIVSAYKLYPHRMLRSILFDYVSRDIIFAAVDLCPLDSGGNSAFPSLLGIFTAGFQKWYPAHYATGGADRKRKKMEMK